MNNNGISEWVSQWRFEDGVWLYPIYLGLLHQLRDCTFGYDQFLQVIMCTNITCVIMLLLNGSMLSIKLLTCLMSKITTCLSFSLAFSTLMSYSMFCSKRQLVAEDLTAYCIRLSANLREIVEIVMMVQEFHYHVIHCLGERR